MPANRRVKLYATLNDLNKPDLYSLILFTMYKLKDSPEYSTLSELSYVLDEDNLVDLLAYYGGMTIKIPTLHELKVLMAALRVYQQVNLEDEPYSVVVKDLVTDCSLKEIEEAYKKIAEVISDYHFQKREDEKC